MHSLNIDFFKEIRREAYVKAIGAKMAADNVVGTFGNVDEAFLRAYSLIPYPIISVDGFIYQYGDVNEDCDTINSTRIYLETGKCPILFSSKFIVHSNLCPIFVEKISKVTDKKFISITDEGIKGLFGKDGDVFVMATKATCLKHGYREKIKSLFDKKVYEQACPSLVSLIEDCLLYTSELPTN